MVNKKPVQKGKAEGGGIAAPSQPPSLVDDAKRLVNGMAEVTTPTRGKFSADYLIELEDKRIGLQQAAAEFLAGLEKYQWLIDAIMERKAERARLRAIDPEQLTNPIERAIAFAQMARMTNEVMKAMHKENPDLLKVAMEGIIYVAKA